MTDQPKAIVDLARHIELIDHDVLDDLVVNPHRLLRSLKGTYKTSCPIADRTTLELRVDVDGRRPQQRLSGDFFKQVPIFVLPLPLPLPLPLRAEPGARPALRADVLAAYRIPTVTRYERSFVVETVTRTTEGVETVLTGPIHYYDDPSITDETIEVRIRRVTLFQPPAEALVRIYRAGALLKTYLNAKTSEYFRTATLEIDRYQGTAFPPAAQTALDPNPGGLPATLTAAQVFERSGIDLRVVQDDVLSDADSADAGDNWDEGELHDLMEANFDRYGNREQWNVYGVVVPRFGDPNYASGYYGTMFDWGGWQAGDTYLRQGAAIALEAIQGRVSGTLYDTADKQNRLVLQTFIHEIGHAFNLPHSWQRSDNPDSASESFMNYPWGYTGGSGGEQQFWANFRWEFDDDELIWMRHGNRNEVIFGGSEWQGDNLSRFVEARTLESSDELDLALHAPGVIALARPVTIEIELRNRGNQPIPVLDRLEPEDGLVTIFIKTPSGKYIRYVPPVYRLRAPGEPVTLEPGESLHASALVSYGAKGALFAEPGEYTLRAYYGAGEAALASRSLRLRVGGAYDRAGDELAHLMFDGRVAKFMYYGGTERYPEQTSRLQDAASRYEKSHPEIVRPIHAALGHYFARSLKYVEHDAGRKRVKTRHGNLELAERHMRAALAPLADGRPAFSDMQYARITQRLARVLAQQGRPSDAKKLLDGCLAYLERNQGSRGVRAKIQSDIEELGGRRG